MSSVFVSHSSGDDALVSRIVADLRRAGHTVWVDQSDLLPGGAVAGSIQEGIAGSDAFVMLHSHTASNSRWVELEWQAALGRNMDDSAYNLVLVRVDDCKVPLILSSRKWIEMSRGYEGAIRDLLAALGTCEQQRPLVWYFDDSHAALASFDDRHSSAFRVRTFTDVLDLITATGQAARDASLTPEVILLDLHCPRQDVDPDVLVETDHKLAGFLQAERELRGYVDAAWHPVGVDIVESVRRIYPPDVLPIVMHTQQGLFLLRDELLQELEEMGAGWLLKGRFSPETDRMIIERIVLQSGHALDTEKLRVLIIDDNPRFIDAFVDRQSGHYEIEAIENESEVLRTLSRLQAQQAFPDVFVVDMYYPRATDEAGRERIDLANEKLREFAEMERELRSAVQVAYEPLGLTALRQIRRVFKTDDVPVLVYTQSGMLMLDDHGIQEIERLGAGWLLKDRYDARTEQMMILGELTRSSHLSTG